MLEFVEPEYINVFRGSYSVAQINMNTGEIIIPKACVPTSEEFEEILKYVEDYL